ncbi:MAG: lysophospholipid acyltransferase family protein [Gemmataceae bacterium]
MTAVVGRACAVVGNLPPRWQWLFRLFRWYAGRYVAKHLHTVRILRAAPPPMRLNGPTVMVLNHPSWWDPLICYSLSHLWPDRVDWGPMEASALARYKLLSRAGVFGVETGTPQGARDFLRTTHAILADPRATLWVTAQGRFVDVRERPVKLRSGVGHLAERLVVGEVIPVAIEYTFWTERTPECLIAFGEPLRCGAGQTARQWTAAIADELEATQDTLATAAKSRDPRQFQAIVNGRAGIGGVYDLYRRTMALATGHRFLPEHAEGHEC